MSMCMCCTYITPCVYVCADVYVCVSELEAGEEGGRGGNVYTLVYVCLYVTAT